jgi:hypothetical protein
MQMKKLLMVGLLISFSLTLHGQEADQTATVVGTISIEEQVPAKSIVIGAKIEPILKGTKKRKSSSSKTRISSKPTASVIAPPQAIVDPAPEFSKKPIKGIVIFRNDKWVEFRTVSDETGKYEIRLPYGKYFVYSTPHPECWMCADYSNNEFLVDKREKNSLDIVLRLSPVIE